MILAEIIKSVNESSADQKLKDMVESWIRVAHEVGFAEGVRYTTEMQKKVFEIMGLEKV
jgi:hypothetical protein